MAVPDEDIVITGFSARFPQADSLKEFKDKLYAGVDFVTDDETRWPRGYLGVPARMGKIRDLSLFDAEFFGVPPRQAHKMDPQARLLLETSYEAIVDAGYDPATLRGRRVGVFIGCANCESHEAFSFDTENCDGYGLVGSSLSMFANRVAHSFDFRGLSMAVDTGCSSTMAALNQAILTVRSGQCEAAIVGGSALCLKAATSLGFLRLGMLSPDGKCKTFDCRANGYVRAETVGVFFLQRASEARRIYAKVTHIKTCSDGYTSEGITFPSSVAQEGLLKDIYAEANVDPRRVGYVEAHGTGTAAGDVQELCSISEIFCQPEREKPLKVGAVKTNVGHAEPASGISSLAKVILAMETGTIAGNLHFNNPNPKIACLHDGSVEVVEKATPFPGGPVGINSFGLGGTSVHVILEQWEGPHVDRIQCDEAHLPRLVLMAGRSEESLMRALHRLEEEAPLPDSAYTLLNQVGQPSVKRFPYRGFSLVPADSPSKEVVKVTERVSSDKRSLWFVFTGMGCQWKGMAQQMMHFGVFARSISKSHEILKTFDIDLIEFLTKARGPSHCMALVQASIIALQVALVDTLSAVGIHPDNLVGHSIGEIGCAYADGCLTAEQAVMCAYLRGRSIDRGNIPSGAMAAVGLSWQDAVKRCRDGVAPACHNSLDSVTVSGPTHSVDSLVEELSAQGVFARHVDSANVAFHTRHMEIVAPAFRNVVGKALLQRDAWKLNPGTIAFARLETLYSLNRDSLSASHHYYLYTVTNNVVSSPKLRSQRWVSSSVPESRWHEPQAQHCSADYLVENLVAPVLFYEALLNAPENAILIEVGPHCLLQPVIRRNLGMDVNSVGLMERGEDNLTFFLKSLGKLHTMGVQLDLRPLYPQVPVPVPRGTPSIAHFVSWDHSQRWKVAEWNQFAGSRELSEEVIEISPDTNKGDAYLAGHLIDGQVVFPEAGYMVLVWKSVTKRSGKPFHLVPVVFENVTFHRAVPLPKTGIFQFKVQVMAASGEFEVSEGGSLVASGSIHVADNEEEVHEKNPLSLPADTVEFDLHAADIYKDLRLRGYRYSGNFQSILKADLHRPYGKLMWADNWVCFIDSMLQFCTFRHQQRAFTRLTRVDFCRIDPNLHSQIHKKVEDGGITVVYEQCMNSYRAGGITMRGIQATVATRREPQQVPCLEEYRFVPYFDDESATEEREAQLEEYVGVCNIVVRRILQESREELDAMAGLVNDSGHLPEEVLNRYIESSDQNNGLLHVLIAIQANVIESVPLASTVQWALTTRKKDINLDILSMILLKEDPLRPFLDVVVENTPGKKISVLELAFTEGDFLLTPRVSKLLPLSNILLKTEHAVAHPRADNIKAQHLSEDITWYSWNSSSTSVTQLPEAHLVISHVVSDISICLETLAEQLSARCTENGFAILLFRTALTPAEEFLKKLGHSPVTYYRKETVTLVLDTYGFHSVGLKSNKWSTLFLLRKTSTSPKTQLREIIAVDKSTFGWVDTLKAITLKGEGNSAGQTVLLNAKEGESGVIGLMNCLRQEAADSYIRCVFHASSKNSGKFADATLNDLTYKGILERDLIVNVERERQWGSFRHLTIAERGPPKRVTEHAFLNVHTKGAISTLEWYESPLPQSSTSNSSANLLCSVYYAALNIRDVRIATGRIPSDVRSDAAWTSDCLLGIEFSGRDPEGHRVMGLASSQGLATAVAADRDCLWEVPDTWSLAEASTVPIAYSLAYYALLVRGNMRTGESLLVHSGSEEVGQAAIFIALSMGCLVFTTVGSQEKKQFLLRRFPQLQDPNISSSWNVSFEELMLRETDGRGIDLVLNSLPEETFHASVRCLASQGRFMDIDKLNLSKDSSLGKSMFLKGIFFHGDLLLKLCGKDPSTKQDKRKVRALVQEGIKSGVVRPLDKECFKRNQAEEAFHFLASGKHLGKVVLEIRPEESTRSNCHASPLALEAVARTYFHEHKSCIIVGGLGGVGLELANWMLGRGCLRLLLSTRSGEHNGYQKLCLLRWQQAGAQVLVVKADVATEGGARHIIETASGMGHVGAIFNLAMVVSVALFEHQSAETFERVCKPKVDGTRWLDQVSRKMCPNLEHFVVFSSLSSGRGIAGQSNYGYANSVAERICEQRVADGLPGLAIQWGPIGEVGALHEIMRGDVEFDGCVPQRISSCLDLLDHFLNQSQPVVSSLVKAERSTKHREKGSRTMNIAQTVANIFGVKEASTINPNMSLSELGMDSIMGVEIRRALERDYDLSLSVLEIRQLSFARLQEMGAVG